MMTLGRDSTLARLFELVCILAMALSVGRLRRWRADQTNTIMTRSCRQSERDCRMFA
jgi:hypothetical protein